MKTTTALMALAMASMALAPLASADLNVRTFLFAGEYSDFGSTGLGIYDGDTPVEAATATGADNYCFAISSQWNYLAVGTNYYDLLRMWPQAGVTAAFGSLFANTALKGIPVLEDCLGGLTSKLPAALAFGETCSGGFFDNLVNGAPTTPATPYGTTGDDCQWLANDGLNAAVGTAFFMQNLLGAAQVASIPTITTGIEYCTSAAATAAQGDLLGTISLGISPPVPTIGARDIACGNRGSYNLSTGCSFLTYTTVLGSVDLDQPVALASGSAASGAFAPICNSQVGNPGACPGVATLLACGGFISEPCMSLQTFDTVLGLLPSEEDTDHFVNVGPNTAAGDVTWNVVGTGPGLPPAWISNVSDLSGTGSFVDDVPGSTGGASGVC